MESDPKCLRCGGEMEQGFIQTLGGRTDNAPHWIAGTPGSGLFGSNVSARPTHRVVTLRCVKCGHLESFALD